MADIVGVDFKTKQRTAALIVYDPPGTRPAQQILPTVELIALSLMIGMLGFFALMETAGRLGYWAGIMPRYNELFRPLALFAGSCAAVWTIVVTLRLRAYARGFRLLTDIIAYQFYRRQQPAPEPAATAQPVTRSTALAELPNAPPTRSRKATSPLPDDVLKAGRALETALQDAQIVSILKAPVIGPAAFHLPVDPCGYTQALRSAKADITRALPTGSYYQDPLPGSALPGWTVPRANRDRVLYADLISDVKSKAPPLTVVVGKSQQGKLITTDIAKHPHLIVAGVTGSGKSIASYDLILSLLDRTKPEHVKIIIVDQKLTEYDPFFYEVAHLATPIVTESTALLPLAQRLVATMIERQQILAQHRVRDIESYHSKGGKMPYIVIFIDELRDILMEVGSKEADQIVDLLTRIVQRGRSAGLHLVIMTQRPDSDAVPGKLKSQMPGRLMLMMSYTDAQTMMPSPPADIAKLRGDGDAFLFDKLHPEGIRVQCAFIDDKNPVDRSELEQRLDTIRDAHGRPDYLYEPEPDSIEPEEDPPAQACDHEKYPAAVAAVIDSGKPTLTTIKQACGVGSTAAQRMLETMEREGIVTAPEGKKKARKLIRKG